MEEGSESMQIEVEDEKVLKRKLEEKDKQIEDLR